MKPFIVKEYVITPGQCSLQLLLRDRWLYLADKFDNPAFQESTCNQLLFLAHQHQVPIHATNLGKAPLLVLALEDMPAFLAAIKIHFPTLVDHLQTAVISMTQAA